MRLMKSDTDTPEQKLARSNNGGDAQKAKGVLDMIWDEVQAANRAAGPWGALDQSSFYHHQGEAA